MSACERSRVKISTSGLRGPRVRSGPSNQGGSGIYPLPGSVHVRIACFSKASRLRKKYRGTAAVVIPLSR